MSFDALNDPPPHRAQSLAESESQRRAIIESASEYAIFTIDADGLITEWSEGAEKAFGYAADEILQQSLSILWPPEDRGTAPAKELKKAAEDGFANDNRWHMRKGGERFYVRGAMRAIRGEGGVLTGFVKICRDETQRLRTETELADAHARLNAAQDAGAIATWVLDLAANKVYGDANLRRFFDVTAEEMNGGPLERYLEAIHPEDRDRVKAEIARTIESGDAYQAEYRVRSGDVERSVVARGRVERDVAGKAVRLPGVVLDITDRVRIENERRRLASELQTQARVIETVLSSIADFVYTFDRDGRFTYVNQALLDLWRLELKDAVGKNFFELNYPPDLAAKLQRQIEQVFSTAQPLVDTAAYTSPAGVEGFYEYIFSPVIGADGSVQLVAGSTRDTTEQHRTLETFERSEARFRQLADAMPQIVWAAQPDGTLDYYNRRWFEYIELSPDAADKARWDLYIHPDDLPSAYEAWSASLRTGSAYAIDFRVRRADGEYRWFLVRALPMRGNDGGISRWYGTCTDIHDQKMAETALRESEARFADVLRTSLDCIISMDETGIITDWNPAAQMTFGYTREEAMGQTMASLIIPTDARDRYSCGLAAYMTTGVGPIIGKRIEVIAMVKGGGQIPVELTVTPIALSNPPIFTAFIRDISLGKQAEAERESLLESERAARSEAERASSMKDEFLATLSHEIRTPLNAILGWSQIMRQSKEPADIAQGLDIIERNARAQSQIIEDLLDMSRIISGKVRLDVQRLDLSAIVQAAIETTRPTAAAKGVRLVSVIDPLQGVVVSGDASRLQQVLWNLLSNAVKFTPKGGRVQVLLQRVNSHLEISVSDTGEGIKPEFLPYVFDRFRQADASTTRRHGGLGLGLSIVKQLVELHGGSVQVHSDGLGHGTTFTIALPLTVLQPEANQGERRHPRLAPNLKGMPDTCVEIAGVRVLVVDDEPDARALVQRLLEDCHAVVTAASSMLEALELVKTEKFDVLVSDIGMPGSDGYALIKRIRSLSKAAGGDIPAIALTAYARAEDRVRAIAAGFQMHVAKPVEPVELVTMVAGAAGRTGR